MKSRSCPVTPFQRSSPCGDGQSEVTESCNEDPCLPDPSWTEWNSWSQCTQSCGGGKKQRARTCQVPGRSPSRNKGELQKPCPGPSTMVLFCHLEECPPKTEWAPWGPWSQCSKNCGGGNRVRKRDCQVVTTRSGEPQTCPGERRQEGICNEDVPCIQWTDWGSWSSCSVTCGKGSKTRYRKCQNLEPNQIYNYPTTKANGLLISLCQGQATEEAGCDAGSCGSTECSKLGMPNKFFSFSGRPATNIGRFDLIFLLITCSSAFCHI